SIPNKAIEYLAHGLPIMTSLQGPVSALVDLKNCGRTYGETDPSGLARVIEDLHHQPAQLKTMSENALRAYREQFQADSVYGEFADMVLELAKPPKTRVQTYER